MFATRTKLAASYMMYCLSLIGIMMILTAAASELDLGHHKIHVCREDTANITWIPPGDNHNYQYIDVYYTRRPEKNNTYTQITVISWTSSGGWQVVARPSRFTGRLMATSQSPTTSFVLENLIRIDNGKYELTAPTKDGPTFVGIYDLVVYVEDNYYPNCLNTDNTTLDEDTSSFVYTWQKSDDSPSVGIKMTPEFESTALESQSCYFGGENTCDVVFEKEDLGVIGRVYFAVEYLFADNFSQCISLGEAPTNLIIDIPRPEPLPKSILAAIVIACVAVVVIGCVVPPLVTRHIQKNKTKMSLTEYLNFVSKCIDYIQNYNKPSDFNGLYRQNTQESVVKCYIAHYKRKQRHVDQVNTMFHDIPKKDLASCVKYVLKIADEQWLPPDVQISIASGDTIFQTEAGNFDTGAARLLFQSTGTKKSAAKRMILAVIFRHFDMFLTTTVRFDEDDRRAIVNKTGLATCVAPNFFADAPPPDLSKLNEYLGRQVQFIVSLIDHTNQVFPHEDDPTERGDKSGMPLLPV